jgi:hypothetical protein
MHEKKKGRNMEITLEAIISFIGLFIGGGGGAFFTWRYMRRKAKAEAVQAETEAKEKEQDLRLALFVNSSFQFCTKHLFATEIYPLFSVSTFFKQQNQMAMQILHRARNSHILRRTRGIITQI